MSRLIFQNGEGSLCLGGGAEEAWRMTAVSGLGFSAKSLQTVTLFSEAGQRVFSQHRDARTITIAGDVFPKEMPLEARLSQAVRILDEPGWLTVQTKTKRRRIWARCTDLEFGRSTGAYREFQMQFYCESPYFEDVEESVISLFQREKKLKNTFSFPCVMSTRISKGIAVNQGDSAAEPIVEIYFSTEGAEEEGGWIELHNRRNKSSLSLFYVGFAGDTVTVDIPNRRIYNSRGESLLSALSEESFLSDFLLEKGSNELEAVNHASRDICVLCRFASKYLEAMY